MESMEFEDTTAKEEGYGDLERSSNQGNEPTSSPPAVVDSSPTGLAYDSSHLGGTTCAGHASPPTCSSGVSPRPIFFGVNLVQLSIVSGDVIHTPQSQS